MGALTSRQNTAAEETDIGSNHAYKYPPKTGNFFGSHFIMGGERFDTCQPEAYLFGENSDLNFLGSRPTAFPYPPPQANEPTKTLKSLINIRKESVRFVRSAEPIKKYVDGTENTVNNFNIEFIYDSDAKCSITIHYFCTEEITANGISYASRDVSLSSDTFHCKRGVNQVFSQPKHNFYPGLFSDEDLAYNVEKDVYPVAIHCVVDEGPDDSRQSHTTICVIDHHTDGTYVLRALKQKIFVDGLCYLLQEIYGIENKNINKINIDDETDDNGSECVICMSDTRDTLILPCRHLCLCNSCADSLRYQANNCPICRAPFRALLQIRAVQKCTSGITTTVASPTSTQEGNACENIPPGYMPVSLIEALNGPPQVTVRNQLNIDSPDAKNDPDAVQAAETLNKSNDKDDEKLSKDAPEIRMSVLGKDDTKASTTKSPNNHTLLVNRQTKPKSHTKDTVKMINETNMAKINGQPPEPDDSDEENLSPLLQSKTKYPKDKSMKTNKTNSGALHIDGVDESIDDTDTDIDDREPEKIPKPGLVATECVDITLAGAEDSDYFTPEDPHTTILSPLCPDKQIKLPGEQNSKDHKNSAALSPIAAIKETAANSLPDSPISGISASTRSSGDSYSSSSSTRQLLAPPALTTNEINRIVDVKQLVDDKQLAVDV